MGSYTVRLLAEIWQKPGQDMVSQSWKLIPVQRNFQRDHFGSGDLSPNKSFWLSTACWPFSMIRIRAVTVCLLKMNTGDVLLVWIRGLGGAWWDGHSSKLLLEMGIHFSLHPSPHLSGACMGNTGAFLQKASAFFVSQPCSSEVHWSTALGVFLWFLNLVKLITNCKNSREKIGNHFVLKSIVHIIQLKIMSRFFVCR